MDFFKLLKTLNSAQASWQITLALLLGMTSGFLPLATPINFFLIFIAFAINIPLGVFFFISATFAALGYLIDPLFASLGYTILTAPELQALFTSMYNYAPTLWTSFNYTILMGSLVVSVLLSIILFPILNKIINKQRDYFEAKFKESRFFSWLNPYSEEKLKEKPGIMRWWAAALYVGVVGAITAVLLLIVDPLLKTGLEYALSKATKREISIGSLESKIVDTNLVLQNISIIKPKSTNSDIFVDNVTLQLNAARLLEKKLDFTIISFGNISLNQTLAREQHEKKKASNKKSKKDEESSFNLPEMPDPQSILDREGLSSVTEAKKMQKDITAMSDKWQGRVDKEKQKAKLDGLKQRAKLLKKKAKNIHSLDDITAVLAEADALKKESKAIQEELKNYKKEYAEDKKIITHYIKEMKELPKKDYDALLKKYSLDQNGAMNLIGTHFSASLENYLRAGLEYYEFLKPYISSDDTEEIEHKRMKGSWIHYANTTHYPMFVIEKLHANIIKESKNFKLKVKDISNNQKIYAKPLKGTLESRSKEYKEIFIRFEHNELTKNIHSTLNADVQEYKIEKTPIAKKLSLESALMHATATFDVTNFTALNSEILVTFQKTALSYAPLQSKTDRIVQDILSGISEFHIDAWVVGSLIKPSISLQTDLDNKLKSGIKKGLNKEVQKYKKELKATINKRFKEELGDIDLGEFNDVEKLIDTALNDNDSLTDSLDKYTSKEALQKQLQSDSTKKLKNKILKFF